MTHPGWFATLWVETGAWLSSRKVLISPISILRSNWTDKELPVALTKDQGKDGPSGFAESRRLEVGRAVDGRQGPGRDI